MAEYRYDYRQKQQGKSNDSRIFQGSVPTVSEEGKPESVLHDRQSDSRDNSQEQHAAQIRGQARQHHEHGENQHLEDDDLRSRANGVVEGHSVEKQHQELQRHGRQDHRQQQEEGLAGQQAGPGNRTTQPEGGGADSGVALHQLRDDQHQQPQIESRQQPGQTGNEDPQHHFERRWRARKPRGNRYEQRLQDGNGPPPGEGEKQAQVPKILADDVKGRFHCHSRLPFRPLAAPCRRENLLPG